MWLDYDSRSPFDGALTGPITRIHDLSASISNGPAEPVPTAMTKLCLNATAVLFEKRQDFESLSSRTHPGEISSLFQQVL